MNIAEQYLKAWNDHDSQALLNCFNPDGVYIDANLDDEIPASVFALRAEELFNSFPQLMITVEDRTESADGMVASRWALRGALPGKTLRGVDMLCIRENKLQSVQVYFDYKTGLIFSRVPSLHLEYRPQKNNEEDKVNESVYDLNNQKYRTSGLNQEEILEIKLGLEKLMVEEGLFLDAEISLANLSDQLNTSTNHLSQVINSQFDCNFYDFINRYRINHAINLLCNETNQKALALALESGFRSTSTFYSAFKKFTGVTPSEYRKANGS